MSTFDLDELQGDNAYSPPPQTPASNATVHSRLFAALPSTKPVPAPPHGYFSSARPMNLQDRVNMAGAPAENPPRSDRSSTIVPPSPKTPEPKSALPALVPLPSGTSFLQAQRLDAPASIRLIDSVFSIGVFEYTDLPLFTCASSRSHPQRASYLKLAIWSMTQRLTLILSTVFLQTSLTSPTENLLLVQLPR